MWRWRCLWWHMAAKLTAVGLSKLRVAFVMHIFVNFSVLASYMFLIRIGPLAIMSQGGTATFSLLFGGLFSKCLRTFVDTFLDCAQYLPQRRQAHGLRSVSSRTIISCSPLSQSRCDHSHTAPRSPINFH